MLLAACDTADAGPSTNVTAAPTTATATELTTATATATATETVHPPPATTTETTTATPFPPSPRSSSAPSQAPDPTPGSSDPEIRRITGTAFGVIDTYWNRLFSGWYDEQGGPIAWWTPDRHGDDGFYDSTRGDLADCHGDFDTAENAFFCPYGNGTGFVAWDMELFRQEALFGDKPIYAVVAHEVGHAAQARFWADNEQGATPPRRTVAWELQADCLAGATLGDAGDDGYLAISAADFDDIVRAIKVFNEDGGDHGTDAQRVAAFTRGFNGDIESCLYNQGVPPTT